VRRKITISAVVSVAVLCIAAVAYATTAPNSYSGSSFGSFAPKKAGSKAHPSPIGFVETLNAKPGTGNVRAAPLTKIVTKVYGIVANAKPFPTCSASKIATPPKYNGACNPRSLVASGFVNSLLGNPDLSTPGSTCNPGLDVYNGGPGKLVFFFFTDGNHQCGGLKTGATAPYVGTVKQVGKYQVTTVPLPPDISTTVAHIPNFYGSLIHQFLKFRKLTTRVHGKTVALNSSIGCLKGKRPWTITFTAFNGGQNQTSTVKGSSKC
jgi:hypothetical protein